MNLAGRIFRKIVPRPISYALTCLKVLEVDYGHFTTTLKWTCVDKDGEPIPWYTYPAIEYLSQLDFSGKTVFEYGSGNSSLFWAARAEAVFSIENNENWHKKITSQKQFKNLNIALIENKQEYLEAISSYPGFDIIIIDGSYRDECARYAVQKLNAGGIIILDNSDWYPETAKFIRSNSNLIQVDMKGFAPINFYTSTTSLFLQRDFSFSCREEDQPTPSLGSIKKRSK